MKKIRCLLIAASAASTCAVFTGCDEVPSVPYHSNTAAAAIVGDHSSQTDGSTPEGGKLTVNAVKGSVSITKTNVPIEVCVEAGDPEISRYLRFSTVQVRRNDEGNERSVKVYTEVTPQCLAWRVSLIKNGREYYHFITSNQQHLWDQVIPLQPLALEPDLPVPDKIIVTLVK